MVHAGFQTCPKHQARRVQLDQLLQDGTPWRKRTAFLSTGLVFGVKLKSELARTMRQCSGRGACSRTGKPHQPLRGIQVSSWRYFTILAGPPPRRLCKSLAELFTITRSEQCAPLPPSCWIDLAAVTRHTSVGEHFHELSGRDTCSQKGT